LRKQIRFETADDIKTIELAVRIINVKSEHGERISFARFAGQAAHDSAVQILKENPDLIASLSVQDPD